VTGSAGTAGSTGPTGATGVGPAGSAGPTGPEGKASFPETEKEGGTETGYWTANSPDHSLEGRQTVGVISFPVPLPVESTSVTIVSKGETASGACTGGTISHPTATPGALCIFTALEKNNGPVVRKGVYNAEGTLGKDSLTGAQIEFEGHPEGTVDEAGSWAVTAI
jgi:hypothetical protein